MKFVKCCYCDEPFTFLYVFNQITNVTCKKCKRDYIIERVIKVDKFDKKESEFYYVKTF